ncbi:MAG: carbohydrate porin [Gammaproteobacteria bacterium]
MRLRVTHSAMASAKLAGAPHYGKWLLALLGALAASPRAAPAAALDPIAAEDEPAVSINALYVGDLWRNASGGLRDGSAYLGNANVSLAVDGARALGLDGTTFYADAQVMHGQGASSRLFGDAQVVSNIETTSQVRLYELWMERGFGESTGRSVRFGLYDLNSEFDSLETAHLFLNASSGVSPTLAQTGQNGPSIFPVTSLGARFQWSFSPAVSARMALMDGVPGDPDQPKSNRIRFGSHDGLLAVTEVAFTGARLHKLAIGGWTYTARFDEIVPAGSEESPAQLHGNRGFYAIADGQLYAESDDSTQGLNAFVRVSAANDRINRFQNFVGMGVVYTGALPNRPEDRLGIAISSVGNGDVYRRVALADGLATDRRETNIELSYRFGVTKWLTMQTSVQHISNPDTNPDLRDAVAVGLRFELTNGWSWPPSSRHR